MDKQQENRALIIGGGLMGSAAAWELSRAGYKVLLIEQQGEKYVNGSSFGAARVTRSLGVHDDIFTYLKEKSVKETQILMEFLGEPMETIYRTSPVTYLYPVSNMDDVDQLIFDADYEVAMNADEAIEKFGMTIKNEVVIREHKVYSGVLNPGELIRKLHQGILAKGGKILYGHTVRAIRKSGKEFEIDVFDQAEGSSRTIVYKKVVLSVGPYTGSFLENIAPYFSDLVKPKRLYLSFFKPDPETYRQLSDEQKRRLFDGFPVARFDDEIFYAMIERFDENGIPEFKVGGHNRRFDIKGDLWKDEIPQAEIEWSKGQLSSYLASFGLSELSRTLEFSNSYCCIYSMTADEIPYVSKLVKFDRTVDNNFVVIAGLSGIGAKGTLCYGKIAADLISGNEEDDRMYRITRDAMGHDRVMFEMGELGLM